MIGFDNLLEVAILPAQASFDEVSSDPLKRAQERMDAAAKRGGVMGMISATQRRVKATSDKSKLRGIADAVDGYVTGLVQLGKAASKKASLEEASLEEARKRMPKFPNIDFERFGSINAIVLHIDDDEELFWTGTGWKDSLDLAKVYKKYDKTVYKKAHTAAEKLTGRSVAGGPLDPAELNNAIYSPKK